MADNDAFNRLCNEAFPPQPRGVPPCEGPALHGQTVPQDSAWQPDFDPGGDDPVMAIRHPPSGEDTWPPEPRSSSEFCGMSTGMLDYRQAVPAPLLAMIRQFCEGVTEREPNQYIGRKNSPYIDRWFLARKAIVPARSEAPDFADVAPFMRSEIENIYLHGYHRGDADEPHDHPWPNASLVVRGWYREAIYDLDGRRLGDIVRLPGDIVLRSSRSVHAILETSEGCLSLFATLRKERDWGFHTANGFVPWREFDAWRQRQPAQ